MCAGLFWSTILWLASRLCIHALFTLSNLSRRLFNCCNLHLPRLCFLFSFFPIPSFSPASSLPLSITLPLKWLAFKAPVIDRQDGFPEPIRQEIPWLVTNEPGKFKGDILYHQVWVWLAVMSCFVLLLTSQVGVSTLMYDGWMSDVCYHPRGGLVDWSTLHTSRWTRPPVMSEAARLMANHTHTWWHNMSPFKI